MNEGARLSAVLKGRSFLALVALAGASVLGACATGGGGDVDAGGGGSVDAGRADSGTGRTDSGPIVGTDAGSQPGADAGPIVGADGGPLPDAAAGSDAGPDLDAGLPGTDAGPDAGPLTPDAGPLCESPCRLLSPQCGCGAQSCDVDDTGARACRSVGAGVEGEACDVDSDCGLGLSCFHDGAFGYCARFCEDNSHCTGGTGSRCLETLPDVGSVQTCTVHCDPIGGSVCGIGFGCDLYLDGTNWYTTCRESNGGLDYSSCSADRDCRDGTFCAQTGHGFECVPACEWPSERGCIGLEVCTRFGNGPTIDGVEYGWCHPP